MHYVAILDTGGISYSGDTIVGLGSTIDEAKSAVCRKYRGTRKGRYVKREDGTLVKTDDQINEWYGIRIYGPLGDTQAAVE